MFSTQLWRHGPFVRFFIGATLSDIGAWFNTVAVSVLIYRLTGQVALVATGVAFQVAPRLVLNPLAGVLADRFDRRGLLIALDLFSALAALIPLVGLVWPAHSALPLIYLSILLLQTASTLYWPTQDAYVTGIVPHELLEGANAASSVSIDTAIFSGPALGALVVGAWGSGPSFVINAVSFLVSALLLSRMPRAVRRDDEPLPTPGALVRGYVTIVQEHHRLIALYLVPLASVVPVFYFQAVAVAYARSVGQASTFIGWLYAAVGVGGILGAAVLKRIQTHLPPVGILGLFLVSAPLLGVLALTHQWWVALVLLAASGFTNTTAELIIRVRIQRSVAPDELGRAFGMLRFCMAIGQALGAILGIAIADVAALTGLLWIGFGVVPIMAVGLALSRERGRAPSDGLSEAVV